MTEHLRAETALGAMKLLAEGSASSDFGAFGLSRDEFNLFIGSRHWVGMDRPVVEKIAQIITYGVMDVIGATRFPVSAEYFAAVVAMFVHPCNIQVACDWLPRQQLNASLSKGEGELDAEFVTPRQLFALVLRLKEKGTQTFLLQFEERTGLVNDETL